MNADQKTETEQSECSAILLAAATRNVLVFLRERREPAPVKIPSNVAVQKPDDRPK